MTIFQGEIYWIDVGKPHGSEPAYLCPCVVALNQSQIGTVIVCPLTTNLRRAKAEVLNVKILKIMTKLCIRSDDTKKD
jgi:mRNA interferase MazF